MKVLLVSTPAPAVKQTPIEEQFWAMHYALKEKLTYAGIPKKALQKFGNLENQNVGLLSIASVLRQAGHKAFYLAPMPEKQGNRESSFLENLLATIASKAIEMVCFSAHTCAIPTAISFAKEAKEFFPKAFTVLGGPHASGAKGNNLKELENAFNFVVKGLGEAKLLEIIAGIEGTSQKANIPAFPRPANRLLNVGELPAARVFTSLGCRHCQQCVFCADIHNKGFVQRPLEQAFEEVNQLYKGFGTRYVYFGDENFFFNEKRALQAIEKVKDLNLDIDFGFQARINSASQTIFEALADSGKCSEVQFGIESANQEILNLSNKGLSFGHATTVLGKAKQAGLTTHCYFLVGLPGETRETANQTIDAMCYLLRKGLADFVEYRIAVPFPGSPMYDNAAKHGVKILSRNWEFYRGENMPQHSLKNLNPGQIYALYQLGLEKATKCYRERYKRDFGGEKAVIAAQSAVIEGGF